MLIFSPVDSVSLIALLTIILVAIIIVNIVIKICIAKLNDLFLIKPCVGRVTFNLNCKFKLFLHNPLL